MDINKIDSNVMAAIELLREIGSEIKYTGNPKLDTQYARAFIDGNRVYVIDENSVVWVAENGNHFIEIGCNDVGVPEGTPESVTKALWG